MSRDAKTVRRTSNRRPRHECGFLLGTFCDQPEVKFKSYYSNSCFHVFWWPWPWPLADIYKKMSLTVNWVFRIYCKKNLDRCKTVACRRCDRQTDRQTHKRYWPIYFAKSRWLSQSNKNERDRTTIKFKVQWVE